MATPPFTTEASASPPQTVQTADSFWGLQGFLALDAWARLLIWLAAVLGAAAVTREVTWPAEGWMGAFDRSFWWWGLDLGLWVILFNLIYVGELVVLRLCVPTPREGRYEISPGARPDRQLVWSCLLAVLTKARYEAPFPGFLVFHFANLPPMRWLMGPIFGPRSRSCYVTEPRILDPHLVTIGRNVVLGYNTTITAHVQERDAVVMRRVEIEDDVLIGGNASILGGVHVGRGAMIGSGALVKPDTVIGPNEFWAGVPARKIRDLPPVK